MYGNQASGFLCPQCGSVGPHRIFAYDTDLTVQLLCDCDARWWQILYGA